MLKEHFHEITHNKKLFTEKKDSSKLYIPRLFMFRKITYVQPTPSVCATDVDLANSVASDNNVLTASSHQKSRIRRHGV